MSQNVSIDQNWTPEDGARLLDQLQPGQQLEFYAADHASPTDPGAYI